jgi:hypothetical protein
MSTLETATVTVTIDAPLETVSADIADPSSHLEWATEFFSGSAEDKGDGTWQMNVPRMGGPVLIRIDGDTALGVIDMYLAPVGAPFDAPLPIRVIPNGGGSDVLFTLTRFPGQSDQEWTEGLHSMKRELENLKTRHES